MRLRSTACLSLCQIIAGATSIANPPLDLSSLGHVALTGDFSGISIYDDTKQTETLISHPGDGLYNKAADGTYVILGQTDGSINAICPLTINNAQVLFLGGNFTKVGNISALNFASYNVNSAIFQPLDEGVSGTVNSLLCVQTNNTVIVGGDFDIANSSNTAVWDIGTSSFLVLPFGGFDGPVNTIVAYNDSIIFGGKFDSVSDGSSGSMNARSPVNLETASLSANFSTSAAGYFNPANIVCPSGQDGSGDTWLLSDNQAGSWVANFNFTFKPVSFRIYNTHLDGRGTKEFRFVSYPTNGILNLTYTDPTTQTKMYCDARCPLSDSTSIEYTEFTFVNVIPMTGFSLDISAWYGLGGGLSGFEIFQDDINAYAINAFNEPTCTTGTFLSQSSSVGQWTPVNIANEPGYLAANLSGVNLTTASVTMEPQLTSRGNYTVRVYTPGCLLDNTCAQRGGVVVSVYANPNTAPTNMTIYQTNDYDKYDTVYQGLVTPSSSSFRPHVIVSPLPEQSGSIYTVVSRTQFIEMSSLGASGLNGLYEYVPKDFLSATESANTTLDQAGGKLNFDADINSVVVAGSKIFVAGNFSGTAIANILVIDNVVAPLAGSGLNGAVNDLLLVNSTLYVAGNFTALINSTVNASHVVSYDINANNWSSLGGGVNAPVSSLFVVGDLVGVSGSFTALSAADGSSINSEGTAFWDSNSKTWRQSSSEVDGTIDNLLNVGSNNTVFVTGQITSAAQLSAEGVASLVGSDNSQQLEESFNLRITAASSLQVFTGTFYNSSSTSLTIIGGHFNATDSTGTTISNIAMYNKNGSTTGLPIGLSAANTFFTSYVGANILYLGGTVSGSVNGNSVAGLVAYDLSKNSFSSSQPPGLTGPSAFTRVSSLSARPGNNQIVAVGDFESAGSLSCPGFCVLDPTTSTWSRPALGLSNVNISNSLWIGSSNILLSGNMTFNNTIQYLIQYDFTTQAYTPIIGPSQVVGPINVVVTDTNSSSSLYVAGQDAAGLTYFAKWNGSDITDLTSGLQTTSQIYALQFVPLSTRTSSNSVMPSDRNILVLGNLNLTGSGSFSGALFDGAKYTPYLLSNTAAGSPGSIYSLFSEQSISFNGKGSKLARGIVIVIALAISLFLVFLIVAIGVLVACLKRRKEGYKPMFNNSSDQDVDTLPPKSLFGEQQNFQSHRPARA